jgi:hypothetical protein
MAEVISTRQNSQRCVQGWHQVPPGNVPMLHGFSLVIGAEMTEYIIPSKNLKSSQYQFLFLALFFLALVINVHVLDIGLVKLGGV